MIWQLSINAFATYDGVCSRHSSLTTEIPMTSAIQAPANRLDSDFATTESTTNTGDLVAGIVRQLTSTMNVAVGEIRKIHLHSHFLSVNAAIEAERADTKDAAFSEVAKEVQRLSSNTEIVADDIEARTHNSIDLVCSMAKTLCGTRLSDIALNSLDLIDRNLYERTCDVRWWATDSALVDALQAPSPETISHACERLGVILDAYTVYFDIVLCNSFGKIIANGRPQTYASIGRDVSKTSWYEEALATQNGGEYAFESAQQSTLVDHQSSLIYSAAVRKNGKSNALPLGVLGVIFNWQALACAVLENASLSPEESSRTLRLIIDDEANIVASSRPLSPDYQLPMEKIEPVFQQSKGYAYNVINGQPVCIAHARSPGFETYATGWHAVLIQDLD